MVKILALLNNLILIAQVEEVETELGGPDCKLTNPYVVRSDQTLEQFLCGYTSQDVIMMSSDKILTLVDPKPTLLEKYQNLIK
jgi:hypothetical protein